MSQSIIFTSFDLQNVFTQKEKQRKGKFLELINFRKPFSATYGINDWKGIRKLDLEQAMDCKVDLDGGLPLWKKRKESFVIPDRGCCWTAEKIESLAAQSCCFTAGHVVMFFWG